MLEAKVYLRTSHQHDPMKFEIMALASELLFAPAAPADVDN